MHKDILEKSKGTVSIIISLPNDTIQQVGQSSLFG